MDGHRERVERVAAALRAHPPGRPVSFHKKAVSHQVPKRDDLRRHDDKIDVADLDRILTIDVEARTCTAEPGVTFTDLVRATLPLGLAPTVVPELRTITVGGAVAGCSLESMSFRHGGFHDSCLEYEVVSAKGEVKRCSPTEEPLLFQMLHGSFGTLGVLTELTFRLVPAKTFVHLVHETHATLDAFQAAIRRRMSEADVDFLDGFVHSPSHYVLSVGRFVDEAPHTSRYDWLKVYFESTKTKAEDWLETEDYFFRYDNGVTNVHPKSAIGRFFLGPFLHSAELLRLADKLHHLLPADRPSVTVDLFIPFSRVPEYLRWHDEALGFYPLWCVPYRRVRDYEWIARDYLTGVTDDLFLDLAIYGLAQPPGRNLYREIEEELFRVQGLKTLISYNFYDEDEFWRIFDRPRYEAVKAVMDPDGILRDLYTKTCRAARGLR